MAFTDSPEDEDEDLDQARIKVGSRSKVDHSHIQRHAAEASMRRYRSSSATNSVLSEVPTAVKRKRRSLDITEASERVTWDTSEFSDDENKLQERQKQRKSAAKKNALKSARRARAIENEINPRPRPRATGATTGVGRRATKRKQPKVRGYGNESNPDEDLMEWTVPEYVRTRRAKFDERTDKLKAGGLHLPPSYEDVYFSDDERLQHLEERPDFPPDTACSPYKDIELPYSLGLIPASIAQFLRDYQVAGTAFLHELFVYQKGGILGDDMGLGKTVQVIAFLTAAYGKTGDERDQKRMRKMRKASRWYPRTLVICPGTLMQNWRDEFQRWGWWQTDLYHGGKRRDVFEIAQAGMLEVMITTYRTYSTNKEEINMIQWDCVVADECHNFKEMKSDTAKSINAVNALCRIGLTGTAIQNKYEEFWTLLNWTNPGKLGPVSTWKTQVCEPLKLGQSHSATNYQLARARKTATMLRDNLLPQFFLRRTKTIIQDQLPKKSDRVVFCPLTSTQARAYQNFLESDIVEHIKNSGDICECGSKKKAGWCCHANLDDGTRWQDYVFPAINNLHHLSNHIGLLIPSSSATQDKQAKDLETLQIAMPEEWRDIFQSRDSILHTANPEYCGKWKILKKLLKFWHDQGNNKVLVFSHSVRLLKMLQNLFISTKYNVTYLDGEMAYEARYAAVNEFNTDPSQFVFLISTKAGGVGLNITAANKVVVVDPNWNPSYDLQAQDRAYRFGQKRDVEVFRLISQGTLEEIIYARQIYKQQQANIGYNATSERRYFQGVQDRKDQKGEIFGLKNLFAYQNEHTVLRDIVNKTNVAESKANVRVAAGNLHQAEEADSQGDENVEEEDTLDDRIKREEAAERAAMAELEAEITGEAVKRRSNSKAPFQPDETAVHKHDPIRAILSSVGVSYTHENSEVIGSSKVEAFLSKRAAEAAETNQRWGTQEQLAKVFQDESQSQSDSFVYKLNNYPDGVVTPDSGRRYIYHPPESVMKRQFCSMARWAGHGNDVVSFALRVENWTQAQRRECLDRFYHYRRDFLDGLVKEDVEIKPEVRPEVKEEPLGKTEVKEEIGGQPRMKHEVVNDSDVETASEDEDDEL
ncbi:uncharacterized protein A1O9_10752 [Exophiala aquamarina CBS 119918]|uniref:DNA excision repair protein ERCC-6 n=1 Tax=Exophiala aquamarina CBS 119918 TaxID=1182545 RepID=A0A072NZN2_9EURO|nr:uncharacterized protein A1O9_10752 [Exophiala aquamarina CBS 119918]KEF53304.1 hypothetical protein A1O9_10752 [Exophiala aquamarina CBS 119918]